MPAPLQRSTPSLAEKIRRLLAARGLTLAEVSRKSRSHSHGNRLHHIPHNLYDAIRRRQFSPSVYQLATLSRLSGYRFVDWLQLFGLSLDDVSRFQISFPSLRTVELDARLYHPGATIPWFRDVAPFSFSTPLVPLSQWLMPGAPRRADSFHSVDAAAFRYVKIGSQDAFAFPDLLPGSIVRVNPRPLRGMELSTGNAPGTNLYLVEYGGGLLCSQIQRVEHNRILLFSRHLPYATVELEQGTQATVLGVADGEIRRTAQAERPTVPESFGTYSDPLALPPQVHPGKVGEFLKQARKRCGLSFRDASERSRMIAQTLRDSRYFCAPGSLSDYETRDSPPRHIHKLISLCAVYFVSAAAFLDVAGVHLDKLGQLSMPIEVLGGPETRVNVRPATGSSECMKQIEHRFEQLPFFLHRAMPVFFDMADVSVRDIFGAGGVRQFNHPYLSGAAFLVVDRRKKKALSSLSCPKWAQPLYVFQRRDGSYLCGSYSRLNEFLVIHPWIAGLPKLLRLRDRTDVEVVGRIVGIVRQLQ